MSDERRGPHDSEPPEGRYANHFKLGHNAFEFVLDFGQFHSEAKGPRYHTRVITSPVYAKSFLELFQRAVCQYESTYGTIPMEEAYEGQDAG